MNTEKLTPAQQVFINEMINGASQKQAYMAAYPAAVQRQLTAAPAG